MDLLKALPLDPFALNDLRRYGRAIHLFGQQQSDGFALRRMAEQAIAIHLILCTPNNHPIQKGSPF